MLLGTAGNFTRHVHAVRRGPMRRGKRRLTVHVHRIAMQFEPDERCVRAPATVIN